MAKKKPTDKFTTPAGTLKGFVALEVPSPKYDTYSATILIEGEMGKKVKKYIDKIVAHAETIHGVSDLYNPSKETSEGVELKLKNKSSFTTKAGKTVSNKPTLWDTENKKVDELVGMGEGTVCNIQIEPYIWTTGSKAGVTLQPRHIQIVELVKYDGGGGSPFDKVDGAFKANNDNVFDGTDGDDFDDEDVNDVVEEDDDDVPF